MLGEWPKSVRETMYHNLIAEKVCEYLQELDQEAFCRVLDSRAVRTLEDIWTALGDDTLDDGQCIDRILAVFYRDYKKLSLRHKDRMADITHGLPLHNGNE